MKVAVGDIIKIPKNKTADIWAEESQNVATNSAPGVLPISYQTRKII